jgi:ABC-type transporter Mla maintaining outer membrane lipid asymmetry permease subunit MlaE
MPEDSGSQSLSSIIGEAVKRQVLVVQDYSLLAYRSIANIFTPPQYWTDALEQMDVIGVGSLPIVVLTGFFIGGVLVLQTASQFERFGETALTGDAVSLALVRELARRSRPSSLLAATRPASPPNSARWSSPNKSMPCVRSVPTPFANSSPRA